MVDGEGIHVIIELLSDRQEQRKNADFNERVARC
jgi:hypothetical protein